MEYIKKENMIDGQYYLGVCRNTYVAMWDAKIGKFRHISCQFQYYLDTLAHFDDVKESSYDGFVPLQQLINPKLSKEVRDFLYEIKYKK